MEKYNVSAERFIEVWQTSESAQEVADKLGMPKPIVLARASNYRSDGIPLKSMRKGPKAARVAELKKHLDEVSKKAGVPKTKVKPKEELEIPEDLPAEIMKKVLGVE